MRLMSLCFALFPIFTLEARPLECQTSFGARGYVSGYKNEKLLIQNLWSQFGSCQKLDEFIAAINVPIETAPTITSTYVICRDTGRLAGLRAAAEEILISCNDSCANQGQKIGNLNGYLACSEGGIGSLFVGLCNLEEKKNCTTALRKTIQERCKDLYDGTKLEDISLKICQTKEVNNETPQP